MHRKSRPLLAFALLFAATPVSADLLTASSLALRSSGSASGTDWVLSQDGYVGTYITLPTAGTVTLSVTASGVSDAGVAPDLQLAVDDSVKDFSVASGFGSYSTTLTLPAGTHFVRAAYANDDNSASRTLTFRNLSVNGASLSNTSSNSNALAAAQTYAANYRQGAVTVYIPGLAPGTPVEFKLRRNAFNFTGSATGFNAGDSTAYLTVANPAPGSNAALFQQHFAENFNTLVPSNGGKWAYTEPTQNNVQMGFTDALLSYAKKNNLSMRQHNLIWGNQQPAWVNTLLTNAQSANPTTAANAKTQLTAAIVNRINYYVGGTAARANGYIELDVLNEALHQGPYWSIYGAAGVADIYNKVAQAAAAAGNPNLRLYTNEYNVLQFSTNPSTGASDPYANWYRQNVSDIRNALAGPTVSGIGVQYYADSNLANHSPARIVSALENLAIERLPISLTEFNIKNDATDAAAAQILTETMELMYGSPDVTTFGLWDFWAGSASGTYTKAALYDVNWNLTPVGAAYQSLLAGWTTDVTSTLSSTDTAAFTGTYGDYDVLINGVDFPLTLTKGESAYTLIIPEPGAAPLTGLLLLTLTRRATFRGRRHPVRGCKAR